MLMRGNDVLIIVYFCQESRRRWRQARGLAAEGQSDSTVETRVSGSESHVILIFVSIHYIQCVDSPEVCYHAYRVQGSVTSFHAIVFT